MPVVHMVMVKVIEGTPDDEVQSVFTAVGGLKDVIADSGIIEYR